MGDDIQDVTQSRQDAVRQWMQLIGVIVVLAGGFLLIQQFPIVGFLQFFLPASVVLLSLRHSIWWGAAALLVSILILSGVSGQRAGMLFLGIIGVPALIQAGCFRYDAWPTTTVSVLVLYYIVLEVGAFYVQPNVTFESHAQQQATVFKDLFIKMYASKGEGWQDFEAQFDALAHVLSITFPLISALSLAIILYVVTRVILKFRKIALSPVGTFDQWQVSEYGVWALIGGGILYHLDVTRYLGINVILGIILLYYLAGCAIILYFLKQKHVSKFFQILAYILLVFQIPHIFTGFGLLLTGYFERSVYLSLPAISLVTGVGLSNVWFEYRKRAAQKQD